MIDNSGGEIDQWEWDFGDGTECIYPAPAVPDPSDICNSNSPKHEYAEIGSYDVTLTVTGPDADPANQPIVSSLTVTDAVRVYILDASFELQTPNEAIGGAWTSLRPDDETESAQHVALAQEGGADAGMPSDGKLWASLDGLGTDGTTPVYLIENGIQQVFLGPKNDTVLEFDYVLLYAEPPASDVLDAVAATVSVGVKTVEIPSARANVASPYVGLSTRFPTRDGSDVRVTPLLTASLDLRDADAFPNAPDLTLYTLTIRTSNDVNEFRSPRVYVDDIRFTAPAEPPLVAKFVLETDPETDSIVAGQKVFFTDTTNCPDPALVPCPCPDPAVLRCEDPTEDPTSWRWDFDTQDLTIPPTASGSGDRDPVYIFPEIGVYEVELNARLADLYDKTSLEVIVIEGPKAVFSVIDPPLPPYLAGAPLTFSSDGSTSDSTDPITAWSWDFGGWLPSDGKLDVQNPLPVTFGQVGAWVVRLTITTASGQTNTSQATITVE
jgi:PKD repeat protein